MSKKNKHQERKEIPVFSGVLKYFPKAIRYVSKVSYVGNEQHNPGTPLDRKSTRLNSSHPSRSRMPSSA